MRWWLEAERRADCREYELHWDLPKKLTVSERLKQFRACRDRFTLRSTFAGKKRDYTATLLWLTASTSSCGPRLSTTVRPSSLSR